MMHAAQPAQKAAAAVTIAPVTNQNLFVVLFTLQQQGQPDQQPQQ